jgi:hypothetical protein
MKVEIGPEGYVIEAENLGPLLRLDPTLVQGLMKSGAITSQFEKGADVREIDAFVDLLDLSALGFNAQAATTGQ